MLSRNKNNVDTVPRICINDTLTLIERVHEYKVLGVPISSDLTWTVHVDNTRDNEKGRGRGVHVVPT